MKYTGDVVDTDVVDVSGKIDKAVIMSKRVIKALVLVVVFFGALITFSILTNQVNEDLTTNMADASLPVMHFYIDDTTVITVNSMIKYADKYDTLVLGRQGTNNNLGLIKNRYYLKA